MLLDPLGERIRGKDLVIVPTGVLSLLPFELLVEKERFLIENHRIRYAPSMTTLYLSRQWARSREEPANGFWGMGDPIYDPSDVRVTGGAGNLVASSAAGSAPLREIQLREGNASAGSPLPRLVYSGEEIRRIGALMDASRENLLIGESASEAKLRESIASKTLSSTRYLHFAAHGVLGMGRGQLPALVLCQVGNSNAHDEIGTVDGLLQLDEIARMQLNADLVVLSACRSGSSARSIDLAFGAPRSASCVGWAVSW